MHFLSEGRDRRVQRWIAEQNSSGTSEKARVKGENTTTPRFPDHLESIHRREHDARADMSWEIEELEREMALTAYTFGKQNWRLSLLSVNSSKLDLVSLKRLSQLTAKDLEVQFGHNGGDDSSSDAPSISYDKRRGARIVSQAPVLPKSPTEVDLSSFLHRCVPPPAPITTSTPSPNGPPITFILQESDSPVPSVMHFTPSPYDADAFPSTPRSFTSFGKQLSEDKTMVQELFLSPRLPQSPPMAQAMQTQMHSIPSPETPFSYSSASDISMSLLSAFPPTPTALYSQHEYLFGSSVEDVPPVPELPSEFVSNSSPIHGEQYVANRDKALPPSPHTSFGSHLDNTPFSSFTPVSAPDDDPAISDSASDNSLSDQFSSRFSVYSSRFSISSLDSSRTPGGKWSHFQFGKAKRAASATASTAGLAKGTAGRARSNSNGGVDLGHSKSVTLSRTTSRAESRAGMSSRMDIKAESRTETHSRANSRNQLHRSNSRNGPRSSPLAEPCTSRSGFHLRSQSNPLLGSPDHGVPMAEVASHENTPVEAHDSQESPQKGKRTIMSRLGSGLKRSKSSGTLSRPRPPRTQYPSAAMNVLTKTHKSNPSFTRLPCLPSLADIDEPEQIPSEKSPQEHSPEDLTPPRPETITKPSLTLATSETLSPAKCALSPKSPVSSSSISSFFQFGRSFSKSEEDRLVLRGVRCDGGYEDAVRRWCETLGVVRKIARCPKTKNLIVHLKRNVANKGGASANPREVDIPEVGIVTISWT
ncbi:hypothetical protein BU17DRAFT_82842 [Hysterangium stoloniferum]|nr:hypothetical protein BU17DRAFT_82842 [Hysterangium stoloniferum]